MRAPPHQTLERVADRVVPALLFATVVAVALHKLVEYDLWWQLAAGQWVRAHGFPSTDPFSYATPDRPWVELRWLFLVAESLLAQSFGLNALIVAKTAVLLVVFGLLWVADAEAPAWTKALGVACALALAHLRFVVRPELVSFLLLAAVLVALTRYRSGGRTAWLYVLPIVQVVWTNAHTLFVLGPATLWAFALGELGATMAPWPWLRRVALPRERVRPLVVVAVVATLACLVNPYGAGAFSFAFQLFRQIQAGNALREMITEFQSPFAYAGWSVFFVRYPIVVAISALGFVLNRRRIIPGLAVVYLAFLYLSAQAERNLAPFGLVAGVATIVNYAQAARTALGPHAVLRAAWAVRATCALLALVAIPAVATDFYWQRIDPVRRFGFGVARNRFPIGAMAFADARGVHGPILANLVDANYVMYRRGPKSVLVDGRLEVYGADVLVPANALFRKGTGFDETVAAHGITAVLVAYGVDGDLFHVVDRKPGWAPIYFDETHVLFVREDAEPDALGAAPRLDWRAPERRSAPAPPDTEASDWLAGFWPHVADDVAPKALGRLGVLTGNLQLARDRYAEAVFVRPDDTEAQLSLGVIARALGDDAAADAALARAGVSVPTATAAAAAFASAGSLEAAAAAYDAIAARGGATPDVYEKLAQTSIAVGRLDDAERAYRRLVAMSPNAPQYWNGLAVVASRRGARDEALASFERSLAVAPAQPAVYTAMAMLRLQGGERDLARAALQKALEIDPSFTSARDQLAALGDR